MSLGVGPGGVVHEHVDGPERFQGLVEQAVDLPLVADVGRDTDGLAAALLDLSDDRPEAALIALSVHHDARALGGHAQRGRLSDAAARTRDDGDLAVKPHASVRDATRRSARPGAPG